MVRTSVLAGMAFVASSSAQFAQLVSDQYALSVNIPSDTASSGSGSIFLQISAPSGTEWVGFGQGSRMAGSNMLVVYAADSTNVTVSPRLGTGHQEPQFNSDASISVLEGSGITSDGTLVANIRCDSCLSWNGGSMDATDSSSSWIVAHKGGDPMDSTDQSAGISQHDSNSGFTLDLTKGIGGSSSNPFVAAAESPSPSPSPSASATESGSPSQTASGTQAPETETETATTSTVATATGPVSNPIASSDPSSSDSSSSDATVSRGPDDSVRIGHATIMSLVFVVLFPLAALTLYLPYSNKVRYIHAPLQVVTIILMLAGLGLGVRLGNQVHNLDGYHMVIGYLLVAWMVAFQPTLGLLQHLHFRKVGNRSIFGHLHRWVGRALILVGVVNGGLGFRTAGNIGTPNVPSSAVAVYSVFAVVVVLVYIAVLVWPKASTKGEFAQPLPGEKPRPRTDGYEMHSRSPGGRRI
ncbi:hypothetical protein A1O7_05634 [Cladophialophora yegresii CBS 114405]|uniref:DOMON domain-containing protein n=1 Tax=Cladophialophora yegresii CBS 114405 TaxID=1182544 RepID=W9WI82_9EURO|nr:uncharacterized protein A1O7_05634 [Cladophialophora yegresii CBS 114405]EXJ58209.1 hypothetical protein A1O7_05634 [Cladophialophora yegresii CBS 114405]